MLKKDVLPTVMQDIATSPPTRLPIEAVLETIHNKEFLFYYTTKELRTKKVL